MKKNNIILIVILGALILVILEWIDKKYFQDLAPDVAELFIKKIEKEKDIGYIHGTRTVYKTIKKDSLLFKVLINTSKNKIILNGITYKKEGKWIYDKFSYNLVGLNSKTDDLLKFYIDSTLVNW
jgi:hypothetical protein